MQRLVAMALVAGSAASSHAQRVAPVGGTAHFVTLDSTMAPLPPPNRIFVLRRPIPSHIVLSLPSASTATFDHGRHGTVWKWVALGALVGAVVGGSVEKNETDRAEYAVPLAVVLGGVGGGLVGALAFHLSRGKPTTSAPPSMTPNER
jgi:hypothetical protein